MKRENITDKHINKIGMFLLPSNAAAREFLSGFFFYNPEIQEWNRIICARNIEDLTPPVREKIVLDNDGIVIGDVTSINEILEMGVPAIVLPCWKKQPDVCNIIHNSSKIMKVAVEYFLARGYKNIALIGVNNSYWCTEYLESFSHLLKEKGLERDYSLLLDIAPESSWSWTIERYKLSEVTNWLKNLPKPAALIACSADFSSSMVNVCTMAGIKVPEEVAILGISDDPLLCYLRDIKISSVQLDYKTAGYEAAKLMHDILTGKKKSGYCEIFIEPKRVVTRDSTDIFATDDPKVLEAIKFIKQNCRRPLQSSEIADEICISRRALEQRFKKSLNRSPGDVIDSVRIEVATQMLEESILSVSQIAAELEYSTVGNFDRAFKSRKGISPSGYRRKVSEFYQIGNNTAKIRCNGFSDDAQYGHIFAQNGLDC